MNFWLKFFFWSAPVIVYHFFGIQAALLALVACILIAILQCLKDLFATVQRLHDSRQV